MNSENRFQLKTVRYAAFNSEETNCFTATLYIDGKRFCKVGNHGQGGSDYYEPLDSNMTWKDLWKQVECLNSWIAGNHSIICVDDWDYTMTPDLETVVFDLLTDYLLRKDLKAKLKKRILAKKTDGKIYCWNCKPAPHLLDQVANVPGMMLVLNSMPFELVKSKMIIIDSTYDLVFVVKLNIAGKGVPDA